MDVRITDFPRAPSIGGMSLKTDSTATDKFASGAPPKPAPLGAPQDARYVEKFANKMHIAG